MSEPIMIYIRYMDFGYDGQSIILVTENEEQARATVDTELGWMSGSDCFSVWENGELQQVWSWGVVEEGWVRVEQRVDDKMVRVKR